MISTLHFQSSNLLYICVQAVAAAAVAAAGAWQVERRACRPCGTKVCLQVEVVRCWQSEFGGNIKSNIDSRVWEVLSEHRTRFSKITLEVQHQQPGQGTMTDFRLCRLRG